MGEIGVTTLVIGCLALMPVLERRYLAMYTLRYGTHRLAQCLVMDTLKLASKASYRYAELMHLYATLGLAVFMDSLVSILVLCDDSEETLPLILVLWLFAELLVCGVALSLGSSQLRVSALRSLMWMWLAHAVWSTIIARLVFESGSLSLSALYYSDGGWALVHTRLSRTRRTRDCLCHVLVRTTHLLKDAR